MFEMQMLYIEWSNVELSNAEPEYAFIEEITIVRDQILHLTKTLFQELVCYCKIIMGGNLFLILSCQ